MIIHATIGIISYCYYYYYYYISHGSSNNINASCAHFKFIYFSSVTLNDDCDVLV
jgi:hypothetical protein